jgi:hypothetical protein
MLYIVSVFQGFKHAFLEYYTAYSILKMGICYCLQRKKDRVNTEDFLPPLDIFPALPNTVPPPVSPPHSKRHSDVVLNQPGIQRWKPNLHIDIP